MHTAAQELGAYDPTSSLWLQQFIDLAKEVDRYKEVATLLEKAQKDVAALQKQHIEPPDEPFLTPTRREALIYRLSLPKHVSENTVFLTDEKSALKALEIILEALQVYSFDVHFHIEQCRHDFERLCAPDVDKPREEDLGHMDDEELANPRKTHYIRAVADLNKAKEHMDAFKNKGKELSTILKELKNSKAKSGESDWNMFVVEGQRFPMPGETYIASKASAVKSKRPPLQQYLGWTLEAGVWKAPDELNVKDGKFRKDIEIAYYCAHAAEAAYNALVLVFDEIGKLEGYEIKSVTGAGS